MMNEDSAPAQGKRVDLFTIFPEFFDSPLSCSILGRAIQAGRLQIECHNLRQFAADKHHMVDDYPYGGGAGMVMKPEPVFAAVEAVLGAPPPPAVPIILLCPQGRRFDQRVAAELAQHDRLALICGHYEGFDERIRLELATDEISIGDYVLTGGEAAALVVVDAVARLIPGVLGGGDSASSDSFATGLLEHPQYTRPLEFRGRQVPAVLLSGHHAEIAHWRRKESLRRTLQRRPDLLATAPLTTEDLKLLSEIKREEKDSLKG